MSDEVTLCWQLGNINLYNWVVSYSIQHCLDAFYISESKWLFSHPFSTAFYLQAIEFLSLRYSFQTKHVIIFMTTYSIGSGSWKLKVWKWYYLNKSLSSTSNVTVVKTSIDLFLQWIIFFFFKDGCLFILCYVNHVVCESSFSDTEHY